jgi:hypothetical protein
MRMPFIPASTPHHHTIRYRRSRANQKTLHGARCHFCEKLRQGQSAVVGVCIRILVGSFGSSVVSPTGDRGAERAHAGRNMSSARAVGHRRCERAVDHMQDKGTCHCLDNQTRQRRSRPCPWRAKQPYQSESLVPESRRCFALRHKVWRVDQPELEPSRAAGPRAHWVAHCKRAV